MVPIRRYLLLRIAGIVLFTILAFAIAGYHFVVHPAQNELARATMELAADRADTVLRNRVDRFELILRSVRDVSAPARARLLGSADLGATIPAVFADGEFAALEGAVRAFDFDPTLQQLRGAAAAARGIATARALE